MEDGPQNIKSQTVKIKYYRERSHLSELKMHTNYAFDVINSCEYKW